MGTASRRRWRRRARYIAETESESIVVAPEYRLAPAAPFSHPLHDCYDVLNWLSDQPYVDSSRVAVGAGSAGGGLAASLTLLAHERD